MRRTSHLEKVPQLVTWGELRVRPSGASEVLRKILDVLSSEADKRETLGLKELPALKT